MLFAVGGLKPPRPGRPAEGRHPLWPGSRPGGEARASADVDGRTAIGRPQQKSHKRLLVVEIGLFGDMEFWKSAATHVERFFGALLGEFGPSLPQGWDVWSDWDVGSVWSDAWSVTWPLMATNPIDAVLQLAWMSGHGFNL